uniref:Uncharacterized protein n=1 Tax=Arundo donax TaxID=35708 RepID=A0A0A9CPX9_ARUDO
MKLASQMNWGHLAIARYGEQLTLTTDMYQGLQI